MNHTHQEKQTESGQLHTGNLKPITLEQLKMIFQAGIDFAQSDHDPREWNQVKDFEKVWQEMNRSEPLNLIGDKLETEEFYNLMQAYRFARMDQIKLVMRRYEAVKNYLRS